jgi:oxygen-independent coproporphyrinogen-3 oxidase
MEGIFRLLQKLAAPSAEYTIEANPDDITPAIAEFWREHGINRVSMGFQSMNAAALRFLGRRNSPGQNRTAYEIARRAGFRNISADMILAVRGDNIDNTLAEIAGMAPEHVSAYHLTIEEGTPLSKGYSVLSDDEYMEQYWQTAEFLEKRGYRRYEVSNYARPGFESRHNSNYWDYGYYIGAGLGASGFLPGANGIPFRYKNSIHLDEYSAGLEKGVLPQYNIEELDNKTIARELIMLGLRKTDGFDPEQLTALSGYSLPADGLMELSEWVDARGGRVKLTRRGLEVMDNIIEKMWEIIR